MCYHGNFIVALYKTNLFGVDRINEYLSVLLTQFENNNTLGKTCLETATLVAKILKQQVDKNLLESIREHAQKYPDLKTAISDNDSTEEGTGLLLYTYVTF